MVYYVGALLICKLQLLVIFDIKTSFDDGYLEAAQSLQILELTFTITFTQERILQVYFEGFPGIPMTH